MKADLDNLEAGQPDARQVQVAWQENLQGLPLLPHGDYQLKYCGESDLYSFKGRLRKAISFEVAQGPYAGAPLKRFYGGLSLDAETGEVLMPSSWSSDINRESALLLGCQTCNFGELEDVALIGRVVTVKKDFRHRELERPLWYSKIESLWRSAT